jgi:hypothetical protein
MERVDRTPDDHLVGLDDEIRSTMIAVDRVIVAAMPGRSRTLWEGVFWGGTDQTIVGYGDLVQTRSDRSRIEWFVVGLARQRRHFSLYVNAVEDGTYLVQSYADRLGKVKVGAANVTFRRVDDLDLDGLAELAAHAHRITPPDERL